MKPVRHTHVIPVFSPEDRATAVPRAVMALREGGLVAFPTETVYGLGADAVQERAVQRVFEAKGRPAKNPLIVHAADIEQAVSVCRHFSPLARQLAETFWPGPLTLVLESNGTIPSAARGGLSTVAVRIPDHVIPRLLARETPSGIVGPSANISGRPSPTTAEHVLADLDGKVDIILDAGTTRIGIESTVIDVTGDIPTLLRRGAVYEEWISALIGPIKADPSDEDLSRSPGTQFRHYAPRGSVRLIERGDSESLRDQIDSARREGKKVGVLTHTIPAPPVAPRVTYTTERELTAFARTLFAFLRRMDSEEADVIFVEKPAPQGIGRAVLDRLTRAAEAES